MLILPTGSLATTSIAADQQCFTSKKSLLNNLFIRMKNGIIMLLLMLCIGGYSYSQQLEHADKIIEVYGQEWFDRMQTDAPDLLVLMDKYVSHGFHVRQVSKGELVQIQDQIETIPLTSKSDSYITVEQFIQELESPNFNPLRYRYFSAHEAQIYMLKGSGMIIYINTQESILQK